MNSSNTARHLENAPTYVVYVLLKGTEVKRVGTLIRW